MQADYFRMQEVLNIMYQRLKSIDFLCHIIKSYLF